MCDLGSHTLEICTPERTRLVQPAVALREYLLPPSPGPCPGGTAAATLVEPCSWRACPHRSFCNGERSFGVTGRPDGCCPGWARGASAGQRRSTGRGQDVPSRDGPSLLNSQAVP